LQAARQIREQYPGTGVLVLSQYLETAYALELLSESAEGVGYLLKDRVADIDAFVGAVRRVGEGGSALDPAVVSQLVGRQRRAGDQAVVERLHVGRRPDIREARSDVPESGRDLGKRVDGCLRRRVRHEEGPLQRRTKRRLVLALREAGVTAPATGSQHERAEN